MRGEFYCESMDRVSDFFQKNVCSSRILAALNMMICIPLVYWLNLLVFVPASGAHLNKTEHTLWGPARPFAGALWPIDWRAYLDIECFGFVLLFWASQVILARFVPIGFRVTSSEESRRLDYRCNGKFLSKSHVLPLSEGQL